MDYYPIIREINDRFSPKFGWPEGFVSAEADSLGRFKLRIGWSHITFGKGGSCAAGGTIQTVMDRMKPVLDTLEKVGPQLVPDSMLKRVQRWVSSDLREHANEMDAWRQEAFYWKERCEIRTREVELLRAAIEELRNPKSAGPEGPCGP